jgi:hypothetical protein
MAGENEFGRELERVRPVTRNLIESILWDAWPNQAAVIDFGLDSQKHYEALYYSIRAQEIMPVTLDRALGNGMEITALVRMAPSNPHKDVEFYTSWDGIFGRPKPAGAISEQEKLQRTLSHLGGGRDSNDFDMEM